MWAKSLGNIYYRDPRSFVLPDPTNKYWSPRAPLAKTVLATSKIEGRSIYFAQRLPEHSCVQFGNLKLPTQDATSLRMPSCCTSRTEYYFCIFLLVILPSNFISLSYWAYRVPSKRKVRNFKAFIIESPDDVLRPIYLIVIVLNFNFNICHSDAILFRTHVIEMPSYFGCT